MLSTMPGAEGTVENRRCVHHSCLGSSFVFLSDKMEFPKNGIFQQLLVLCGLLVLMLRL